MRPGAEAGRPWPGPYQRCRTPRALALAGVQDAGEVDGPDVLLVGVGEARPGVDGLAVDEEPVGVGGRHVGRGPLERPAGRGDLVAQVRDPVGLAGGAGGLEPRRRRHVPVGVTEAGGERGRPRRWSPGAARRPGPDGPGVGSVGGQRRPGVGDERLLGRLDRSAVPDSGGVARVGAADDDLVGALGDVAALGLERPGERAAVGVDAQRCDRAVDREVLGARGGGGDGGGGLEGLGEVGGGSGRWLGRGGGVGARRSGRRRDLVGHDRRRGHPARRGQETASAEPAHDAVPPMARTVSRPASLR